MAKIATSSSAPHTAAFESGPKSIRSRCLLCLLLLLFPLPPLAEPHVPVEPVFVQVEDQLARRGPLQRHLVAVLQQCEDDFLCSWTERVTGTQRRHDDG